MYGIRQDRTYWTVAGVILVMALIAGSGRKSGGTGTYGGGEPTYPAKADSAPVYDVAAYEIVPIDLGAAPCSGCGYDIRTKSGAEGDDMGVEGHLIVMGASLAQRRLAVTVLGGFPFVSDAEAPDPSVQKTLLPETPQALPQGELCTFWFSPFSQLNIRWDVAFVGDERHILLTGYWFRKTYHRS